MRRHAMTAPAMVAKPAARSMDTGAKTFRVSGSGETQEVTADKMIVESDGLTFKDAKGNVVGVFRGYGLSAVCCEHATAQERDPCESVRASDYF